jgi:hypothetical protein
MAWHGDGRFDARRGADAGLRAFSASSVQRREREPTSVLDGVGGAMDGTGRVVWYDMACRNSHNV